MAINPIVFYTPDRLYRITADTGNRAYTVERVIGGLLVDRFTSLPMLESWLREHGIAVDQLIQD